MFTTMWFSCDFPLCSSVACVIASYCNHASQYPLAWSLVTHSFRWNWGWDFPLVLMLFLWQIHVIYRHVMFINVIFTFIFIFWYIEVWKVLFYTCYIYVVHLVFIQCSSMLLIVFFVSFGHLVFCPLFINLHIGNTYFSTKFEGWRGGCTWLWLLHQYVTMD